MKTLVIEWAHLDKDGRTCDRCSDTGHEIQKAVRWFKRRCSDLAVTFRERKLTGKQIRSSNSIWLNGRRIEALLPQAKGGESPCQSCGELIGGEVSCRTIQRKGGVYERVSAALIKEAACRVLPCCGGGKGCN